MEDKWSGKNKTIARDKCWIDSKDRLKSIDIDIKDAKCAVLGDASGRDVEVAMKLGFSKNNIININNNWDVVWELRDKGYIAIYGDFGKVVNELDTEINLVIADTTCGISNISLKMADLILDAKCFKKNKPFVLYFNLWRGRSRIWQLKERLFDPNRKFENKYIDSLLDSDDSEINRAKIMARYIWIESCKLSKFIKKHKLQNLLDSLNDIEFYSYKTDTSLAKNGRDYNRYMDSFITTTFIP